MSPSVQPATADAELLYDILTRRLVRAVYQPIVNLGTGEVVGYEALARGPEGSSLERPDLLFDVARAAGRVGELDWLCRATALRGALDAGLPRSIRLFVNVAADAVDAPMPAEHEQLLTDAQERLDIVIEITEQAIADRPAEMLRETETIRRRGFAIALDDVGAVPKSLALMPLVAPEVVKLDMRLVQDRPSIELAGVANAVSAQAERSGAAILAEGIETPQQVETARALGADFGQGWLFGRPGALPERFESPRMPLRAQRKRVAPDGRTPFEIVTGGRQLRRGSKGLLLKISRQLEHQAALQGNATILLSVFQHHHHYTPFTGGFYSDLAEQLAFVGALATGLPEEPSPGVYGAALNEDDALVKEWNVTVVAPHFAAAFVARDLGDDGPDSARRFDFALTYDRDLAIASAAALMRQIAPRG